MLSLCIVHKRPLLSLIRICENCETKGEIYVFFGWSGGVWAQKRGTPLLMCPLVWNVGAQSVVSPLSLIEPLPIGRDRRSLSLGSQCPAEGPQPLPLDAPRQGDIHPVYCRDNRPRTPLFRWLLRRRKGQFQSGANRLPVGGKFYVLTFTLNG